LNTLLLLVVQVVVMEGLPVVEVEVALVVLELLQDLLFHQGVQLQLLLVLAVRQGL
jgi:hypothetical protein